jgi:hypothetical protein
MGYYEGEPIKGELHSTDASTATVIPIFKQGSIVAYTLAANEYLEIHSIEVITAPGGDVDVFLSNSTSPVAGEVITRGTLAANSGILKSHMLVTGQPGALPYVVAPAGVVDVNFHGTLRRIPPAGTRANYQASLVPGNASFTS